MPVREDQAVLSALDGTCQRTLDPVREQTSRRVHGPIDDLDEWPRAGVGHDRNTGGYQLGCGDPPQKHEWKPLDRRPSPEDLARVERGSLSLFVPAAALLDDDGHARNRKGPKGDARRADQENPGLAGGALPGTGDLAIRSFTGDDHHSTRKPSIQRRRGLLGFCGRWHHDHS